MINRLIGSERKTLLKNSIFIISTIFVFYFTLKVIVEAFWVYGLNETNFQTNVYHISVIVNVFANLLYTIAILWMPSKQRFTLQSS